MRLLTTGFEENDLNAVWDTVVATQGVAKTLLWNGLCGSTYQFFPRTGNGMVILPGADYLRKIFQMGDEPTELYAGMAVYFNALGTENVLKFYTDDFGVFTNYGAWATTGAGFLNFIRSGTTLATSAAPVFTTGQWYYVECWYKPLNAGGRFVAKVDGVIVVDYTGDTTAEEEFISAIQVSGCIDTNGVYTGIDDFVLNDTSGSFNNSYPGIVRLLPVRPRSAGTYAQWDRAGADFGNDMAQLKQSYSLSMMQTNVADEKLTFLSDVPNLPAGATIQNIILKVKARVEAGAGVIAPMVILGVTEDISADQTLQSTWKYHEYAWPENPDDDNPWEESDLNGLEIGVSS